jgi:beta-lactamase regulating signal transducer with metallopeptidase domain/Tfp pilus assembly protein PilF
MNNLTAILNSGGEKFVEFALPMLIQSSVLIVILLAMDLILQKKVRATFRYWLWMLVLVKLVLPPTFSSPISFGSLAGDTLTTTKFQQPAQIISYESAAVEMGEAEVIKTPVTSGIEAATAEGAQDFTDVPVSPGTIIPQSIPDNNTKVLSWQAIVLVVWAVAAGAMVLLVIQRLFFILGLIRQAQPAQGLLTETLEFCRKRIAMNLPVRLKVSANATSPAVCGLFRPVILVPQDIGPSLGVSHLRPVLMHELGHIKRGDLWVNLIQTVLQIIYFYNPLLWLANAVIRRIREQAVDEMVQVAMGTRAQDYPETLLNVAKLAFNRPALALRFIGVVESKSQLHQRIKKMLNQPIPKTAKLGIAGLLIIILVGTALLPMAAAQKENQVSPVGITAEKAKELVEDFFNHNYRDITARQTIEWGEPEKDENGNVSIRYKYEATIWGKDKIIENKIFTFDKNGKYVSAESIEGFPQNLDANDNPGDAAPRIVSTSPVSFSSDVSPDLKYIEVTFDKEMMDQSWSWTGGGDTYPETTGRPRYDYSRRTCRLPVDLEPGKAYWVGINSLSYKNFRSKAGTPAHWYAIVFATEDSQGNPTPIPDDMLAEAKNINSQAEETSHRNNTNNSSEKIPYTQQLTAQIRPDGTIDFDTTIKQINESNSDITTTGFINSDFVEVTSMSDEKGRPIRFTTEHKDDIYSYRLFFNEPIKPGDLMVYSQKGTMTGLVKPIEGLENTYQYYMQHWPATGKSTRRIETYLLPEGANLISTTPSDMGRRMQNGRIELNVDEIIQPGKSITTTFEYSLVTDEYHSKIELKYDDGSSAGKWSFSGGGHGVRFTAPSDGCILKAVRLYGSRYGEYEAPKEDFDVWLCDKDFNIIKNFKFPYSTFAKRGYTKWAALKVDDVELPKEFAICVAFDPHQTKGIYVYYDDKSSSRSYQGIPPDMKPFKDGNWMIRAIVEIPAGKTETSPAPSRAERMEAENLAAQAWKLWAERKLHEAEDLFEKAIEKDPTNANAWNGLGWAQQNLGKKENARYSFEKCLELEPMQAAALNGLGWIAKSDGQTDKAIEYWKKAVTASKGQATASLSGLTETYMELEQYDEAIKYYEMWLKVEPNNEQAKEGLQQAMAKQ